MLRDTISEDWDAFATTESRIKNRSEQSHAGGMLAMVAEGWRSLSKLLLPGGLWDIRIFHYELGVRWRIPFGIAHALPYRITYGVHHIVYHMVYHMKVRLFDLPRDAMQISHIRKIHIWVV